MSTNTSTTEKSNTPEESRPAPNKESWPERVRRCFSQWRVIYTTHAVQRMKDNARRISSHEVAEAASACTLVETRGSKTVLAGMASGRPLHLVCSYSEREDLLKLVTVYEPNLGRWRREISGDSAALVPLGLGVVEDVPREATRLSRDRIPRLAGLTR